MTRYDYEFKILLMGKSRNNKTAFIKRYCYNIFNPSERLTIGVDFHVKTVEIDGSKIKLKIWDVGGEEEFRFLLPTYCLGADGAFVLYNITSRSSLDYLPEYIQIIRKSAGDIPIMLIGSNIDRSKSSRQIPRDYGTQIAEKYGLASFCEISAKENINVDDAFNVMVGMIVERYAQHTIENPNPPELLKITHNKVKNQKKINRDTMKSPIPEDLKEKDETNEDRSIEEKLSAFGDMVEQIMQIILKLPDLFDNSLQDLNSKVTNLQNQLTAINQDPSTLKSSSAPGGPPRIPPLRILETLREQFKEFKNVKKCPNCSDVIKDYNIKICEKCGAELIKERKTNFENFMVNFIEDMQLEIEMQQAYIKKLERKLKLKKNRISPPEWKRPPRAARGGPLQKNEPRVLDAPRRKGNWGYGYPID